MRVCGECAFRMTARVCQARGGGGQAAANANDAAAQFDEYLRGEREAFDFELDWTGVEAGHRQVLQTLCEVAPFGVTVTYGELGQRAGIDDAREIGVMMARNPLPLVVPCHRVVRPTGSAATGAAWISSSACSSSRASCRSDSTFGL